MTEQRFLEKREAAWQRFEVLLHASRREFARHAAQFPAMLYALTGDLNIAKANGFDPSLIERLNRLTLNGNQLLCKPRPFSFKIITEYFIHTLPQKIRTHWRSFAACCLIFYGTAIFVALLCIVKPATISQILNQKTLTNMEDMYNPQSPHYFKPPNITTNADMFAYYIYNNISIIFRTFAGGIFAGIGSLFILVTNAVFLGSLMTHLIQRGFGEPLISFVSGHSALEFTGLILGAQAGLILGYRLFVRKGLSLHASLRDAGKTAFPLLVGGAIFGFFAAIIEAFWSSQVSISTEVHIVFGGIITFLLIIYLLFAGKTPGNAR
ncbi:MAG: stage II sporulation protein M [Spirochaetaceae bacterium]|jgi:uncharacterized membrane protein SpoIIM required for sporulation|nr:stage II sporulation protein M [Spirochaetaceae bacterium]